MNTQGDIWVEFAKSFGMLFIVLAVFLLALYFVRRFPGRFGNKGAKKLINVLSVHHLSPKEKLVLVCVQEESILIGVCPGGISSLARFDSVPGPGTQPSTAQPIPAADGFKNLLKKNLMRGGTTQNSDAAGSGQGEVS